MRHTRNAGLWNKGGMDLEEYIPGMLKELNAVSVTARLMLSLLCGGILGVERGRKKRPAGFRTYMLVCMGAALVMITNQYITELYGGTAGNFRHRFFGCGYNYCDGT